MNSLRWIMNGNTCTAMPWIGFVYASCMTAAILCEAAQCLTFLKCLIAPSVISLNFYLFWYQRKCGCACVEQEQCYTEWQNAHPPLKLHQHVNPSCNIAIRGHPFMMPWGLSHVWLINVMLPFLYNCTGLFKFVLPILDQLQSVDAVMVGVYRRLQQIQLTYGFRRLISI